MAWFALDCEAEGFVRGETFGIGYTQGERRIGRGCRGSINVAGFGQAHACGQRAGGDGPIIRLRAAQSAELHGIFLAHPARVEGVCGDDQCGGIEECHAHGSGGIGSECVLHAHGEVCREGCGRIGCENACRSQVHRGWLDAEDRPGVVAIAAQSAKPCGIGAVDAQRSEIRSGYDAHRIGGADVDIECAGDRLVSAIRDTDNRGEVARRRWSSAQNTARGIHRETERCSRRIPCVGRSATFDAESILEVLVAFAFQRRGSHDTHAIGIDDQIEGAVHCAVCSITQCQGEV